MATGLENYPNINPVSSDYPFGDLRDKTSGAAGTPINRLTNADIHQTFAKILELAGIIANNLPENTTNGHQYIEALKNLPWSFPQGGTTGQAWTKDSNADYDGSFKTLSTTTSLSQPAAATWTVFALKNVMFGKIVTVTGNIQNVDSAISTGNLLSTQLPPRTGALMPLYIFAHFDPFGSIAMKIDQNGDFNFSPGGSTIVNISFTFSYISY